MLLLVSQALWHHRNDQIDGADFVVAIGSSEDDRDGSALLVDEEVHLRSEYSLSVGFLPTFSPPKEPRSAWSPSPATSSRSRRTQWRSTRPSSSSASRRGPSASTSRNVRERHWRRPRVVFVERLPLASRPQHVSIWALVTARSDALGLPPWLFF